MLANGIPGETVPRGQNRGILNSVRRQVRIYGQDFSERIVRRELELRAKLSAADSVSYDDWHGNLHVTSTADRYNRAQNQRPAAVSW
jgi:hypothetical protein